MQSAAADCVPMVGICWPPSAQSVAPRCPPDSPGLAVRPVVRVGPSPQSSTSRRPLCRSYPTVQLVRPRLIVRNPPSTRPRSDVWLITGVRRVPVKLETLQRLVVCRWIVQIKKDFICALHLNSPTSSQELGASFCILCLIIREFGCAVFKFLLEFETLSSYFSPSHHYVVLYTVIYNWRIGERQPFQPFKMSNAWED